MMNYDRKAMTRKFIQHTKNGKYSDKSHLDSNRIQWCAPNSCIDRQMDMASDHNIVVIVHFSTRSNACDILISKYTKLPANEMINQATQLFLRFQAFRNGFSVVIFLVLTS